MVYDCFTFFNELDMLEIRLNILNDVVDKFVLVEATKTHQGKPKPLYFNENKARYSSFSNKIIHVVVDTYPDYEGKSSWILEHHQRNMIMEGLKGCKPHDTIIVSDLDEVPNPEIITKHKDTWGIKIFRQSAYYYFLNCKNSSDGNYKWNGTVMFKYKDLGQPQDFRTMGRVLQRVFHKKFSHRVYWWIWMFFHYTIKGKVARFINNGGWHFSFLGGVDMIIKKLEAFAHTEYNKDEYKDADSIAKAIASGKDIFGRDFQYKFVPIDGSFPKYIIENKDKYSAHIKEQ